MTITTANAETAEHAEVGFSAGSASSALIVVTPKKRTITTVNAETAEHAEFVFSGLSEFSRVLR